ncbi:MAG: M42 family metallopeptidase [Chloroflexi bacterium]|nr:M42 family metallopeptidase [Chloroflexota bacterium]
MAEDIKKIKSLLEKLSNAHGISGYEGGVREVIKKEVESCVDELKIDNFGNLIAIKKGKSPSVMIAAHMDEIGLMVKYIDDEGFIRFAKVGGWFDQTLVNQRVLLHTKKGTVTGVIGSKPVHVMKSEDKKKAIEAKDMFIDVGASSRDEATAMGVEPGVTASLDQKLAELANDRVTGKAFDDRAGGAVLITALQRIVGMKLTSVMGVFTVQEEVGLKGARTSAFGLNPDVGIAIDTCIPGDHPGIKKTDSAVEIGKGPSITVMDAGGRGVITHPRVLEWLCETAKAKGIPYQMDVTESGTTDASAISLTREGIPSGVISVATRYIHTPVEVLSLKDLAQTADLVVEAIKSVGSYF